MCIYIVCMYCYCIVPSSLPIPCLNPWAILLTCRVNIKHFRWAKPRQTESKESPSRLNDLALTPVVLSPWQDDEVVLQCVATIQKENRKFCLLAEGLGNRLCYLEPTSEAKVRFWRMLWNNRGHKSNERRSELWNMLNQRAILWWL